MKQIYIEIKSRRPRLKILTFFIFPVLFSKISRFHWRRQPFRKNVIVEEVLDGIDIDDTGDLEDSPCACVPMRNVRIS